MRYLIAVALLACAFRTPAIVARYEPSADGQRFRSCIVQLGWSEDTLLKECGEPARWVKDARDAAGKCGAYQTSAVNFYEGTGSRYLMVCMSPNSSSLYVERVTAVSEMPPN